MADLAHMVLTFIFCLAALRLGGQLRATLPVRATLTTLVAVLGYGVCPDVEGHFLVSAFAMDSLVTDIKLTLGTLYAWASQGEYLASMRVATKNKNKHIHILARVRNVGGLTRNR